jgi:hypothetical protein
VRENKRKIRERCGDVREAAGGAVGDPALDHPGEFGPGARAPLAVSEGNHRLRPDHGMPGADESYQNSDRETLPPQCWLRASPLRGEREANGAADFGAHSLRAGFHQRSPPRRRN